jgi:hypothetical protein
MCMSCGCKMYEDDMGDSRTIIVKDFEEAALKSGATKEALMDKAYGPLAERKGIDEITEADYEAAAAAMGQTKEDAMKETHDAIGVLLGKNK